MRTDWESWKRSPIRMLPGEGFHNKLGMGTKGILMFLSFNVAEPKKCSGHSTKLVNLANS